MRHEYKSKPLLQVETITKTFIHTVRPSIRILSPWNVPHGGVLMKDKGAPITFQIWIKLQQNNLNPINSALNWLSWLSTALCSFAGRHSSSIAPFSLFLLTQLNGMDSLSESAGIPQRSQRHWRIIAHRRATEEATNDKSHYPQFMTICEQRHTSRPKKMIGR